MADTNITALAAIGANPIIPATFPIPMVDLTDTSMAASGTTKKVTVNQILGAGGTATLASATITGALTVDTTTLVVNPSGYADRVGIGTATPDATLDVTSAGTASTYTVSAVIQDGTYPASGYPTLEFNGFIGGNGYRAGIGSIGGQQLAFYIPTTYGVAPTLAMTLNSTANLVLKGGTAGATGVGVTFPATQVASSDANCLDDYEEGDWTIGLQFGGASTGMTKNADAGKYTKIGNQVTVTGYLALSNKGSSTGNALITGLPFLINSYGGLSVYMAQVTFADVPMGYSNTGTSTIPLRESTNAGVVSSLTDADFANNSEIIFTMTYTV